MQDEFKPILEVKELFLTGICSYYGENPYKEKLNYNTASGYPFSPHLLECACWYWRIGSVLKVSLLDNPSKFVYVRLLDRGPSKYLNRLIDLTPVAFDLLGSRRDGLIKTKVECILPFDKNRKEPDPSIFI